MMKKSNKKGFTLVELIVVIAIMAILAAVLVPTVTSKIKDANSSAAKSDISTLANSIQADVISHWADETNATLVYIDTNGAVKTDAIKGVDKTANVTNATTGNVFWMQKKGGDDTWYISVNLKTGTVSEPTTIAPDGVAFA